MSRTATATQNGIELVKLEPGHDVAHRPPRELIAKDDCDAVIAGASGVLRRVREIRDSHLHHAGVQTDEVLWPMYPAHDLEGAIRRLSMFLQQYWGGPGTYGAERGHPRLRMRHAAFKVNPDARDRWLAHMRVAVDSLELAPLHEGTLWDYLDRAAHSLVNTFDDLWRRA